MNKLASAVHDATHHVPGVPAHSDLPATPRPHRTRGNPRPHGQSAHPHDHGRRHQTPPRILVAWQNWISRLVGSGNRRR
ncbi:hypothetical protein [Leifsonia sp. NPDC058230]|uniref:hypothetical protein n=1 Tax=Leifsonia sp. NPDC058230 TaxID=3346391 RepID=UPI0036DF7842